MLGSAVLPKAISHVSQQFTSVKSIIYKKDILLTSLVGAGVGLAVGTFVGAGVGGFEGAGVGCIIKKETIL